MTRAEMAELSDSTWAGPQLCYQCGRQLGEPVYLSDSSGHVHAQLVPVGRIEAAVPHGLAFCSRECAARWLRYALGEYIAQCDEDWQERAA